MNKSKSSKILGLMRLSSLFFVFVIVWICFVYRDKITLENIIEFTPQNMFLAVVYILICYGVKSVSIIFPIAGLFLLSSRLFLPVEAILVNLCGMVIALSIPYWVGKFLGLEMYKLLEEKYSTVKKINNFGSENQLFFVYMTRAVNLLPVDVLSLILGSCGFSYKTYLAGSLVGMFPTMVAITVMGQNITNITSPSFLISMGITVIFSVLPVAIFVLYEKKKSKND